MRSDRFSWPRFTRVWQRAALLEQVMFALQLDPLAAVRLNGGLEFQQARARCLHCQRAPECERALSMSAGLPLEACANSGYFDQVGRFRNCGG